MTTDDPAPPTTAAIAALVARFDPVAVPVSRPDLDLAVAEAAVRHALAAGRRDFVLELYLRVLTDALDHQRH